MTDATVSLTPSRRRARREDRVIFTLLFVFTFPFFLAATVAFRLLGRGAETTASGEPLSIFGQAKAAASAAIPYAFMG
jgi:hypothetical protein